VVFTLRLAEGATDSFIAAYQAIRHQVALVDGFLGDEVCESTTDPQEWVITSEWESLEHFQAWESSAGHRELAAPLVRCATHRESRRYHVRLATEPRQEEEDVPWTGLG
jgi:heme-degrading monooxygenase HmoA